MATSNRLPRGALAGVVYLLSFIGLLFWALNHDLSPTVRQPEQQPHTEERAESHNQSEARKPLWERITDDPVAFTTLCLVIATSLLAVSTVWLVITTRRSVIVAERSLTELERPFVYMEVVKSGMSWDDPDPSKATFGDIVFRLVNHGRTPAQLIHMTRRVVTTKFDQTAPIGQWVVLPAPVDPTKEADFHFPVGAVIPHAGHREFAYPFPAVFSDINEFIEVTKGQRGAFLTGYVRYLDIFGSYHITGFCSLLDVSIGELVLAGGQQYNYTRAEGKTPGLPVKPDLQKTADI